MQTCWKDQDPAQECENGQYSNASSLRGDKSTLPHSSRGTPRIKNLHRRSASVRGTSTLYPAVRNGEDEKHQRTPKLSPRESTESRANHLQSLVSLINGHSRSCKLSWTRYAETPHSTMLCHHISQECQRETVVPSTQWCIWGSSQIHGHGH